MRQRPVGLLILTVASSLLLGGCAVGLAKSMHQFSAIDESEAPKGSRVRPIEVEDTHYVPFIFDLRTDYAEIAYNKLLKACPGELINVRARHSTNLGTFAYDQKLKIFAECIE